jgi:hypothetical protein
MYYIYYTLYVTHWINKVTLKDVKQRYTKTIPNSK